MDIQSYAVLSYRNFFFFSNERIEVNIPNPTEEIKIFLIIEARSIIMKGINIRKSLFFVYLSKQHFISFMYYETDYAKDTWQ